MKVTVGKGLIWVLTDVHHNLEGFVLSLHGLTLVILRVFPTHIFLGGLLQPPSGLSILKVI